MYTSWLSAASAAKPRLPLHTHVLKFSPLLTLCQFIALLFFALRLPSPNAAVLGLPTPSRPPPSREKKKNTNPSAELTFVSFSFLFLVKYYRLFCWKKKSWYCVSMFLSTFNKHSHFINGKRPQCVPAFFFSFVLFSNFNFESWNRLL